MPVTEIRGQPSVGVVSCFNSPVGGKLCSSYELLFEVECYSVDMYCENKCLLARIGSLCIINT